jgi:peptidoglycan/xylan/chitin deacetylase (PgdA/CDA1 family)
MTDIVVLCFHAVSHRWPADLSTTPERLEELLAWLVGRGYRGATFHAALFTPPAPRTVAVTFDDAYRSVIDLAFPILDRLGLPGTVFVPTDWAGTEKPMVWPGLDRWMGSPYESELMPMSWGELDRLASAGWEVGSHSRSHPRLTQLADGDLRAELAESREACEQHLGRPCPTVAYPYGDTDERVAAAAEEAGYAAAAALPTRFRPGGRFDWPRIGVYHGDGLRRFRVKVSPVVRRLPAGLPPGAPWTGSRR